MTLNCTSNALPRGRGEAKTTKDRNHNPGFTENTRAFYRSFLTPAKDATEKQIASFKPITDEELTTMFTAVKQLLSDLAFQWEKGTESMRECLQNQIFPNGLAFDGCEFVSPQPAKMFALFQTAPTDAHMETRRSYAKRVLTQTTRDLRPNADFVLKTFEPGESVVSGAISGEFVDDVPNPQISEFEPDSEQCSRSLTRKKAGKINMASPTGFEPVSPP